MPKRRAPRARNSVFFLALAGATLGAARDARATPPAPPPATPHATGDEVEMRPIDRATALVIGVQGLGWTSMQNVATHRKATVAGVEGGHGSGVLIDSGAVVLTAKHVVHDAKLVVVKLPADGAMYAARVVYEDPDRDIAFVALRGEHEASLTLPSRSRPLRAGEAVTASGYPWSSTASTPAITSGQVSRMADDGDCELAMSVNPGNSGGPVTDAKGTLLGIIVRGADPKAGAQGLAQAEPLGGILAAHRRGVTESAKGEVFDAVDQAVAEMAGAMAVGRLNTGRARAHAELVALARSGRQAAMVIAAAYTWDMLVLRLEDGGVAKIEQLPDAAARASALQMRDDALALGRAALAVPARLKGTAAVVDGIAQGRPGTDAEAPAPSARATVDQTASEAAPPGAVFYGKDEAQAEPTPTSRPSVELAALGGLVLPIAPKDTPGEFGGAVLTPVVGRLAGDHLMAVVDLEGLAGTWRGATAWSLGGGLGVRADVGLGGAVGLVGSAAYTPGIMSAENRSMPTWLSYRAVAGVRIRRFTLGTTFQETRGGADSTLRTLGLYAETGL